MKRPPLPLVLLLSVVAVFGAGWTLMTAPWQAPDEIPHFGYVQTLVENKRLPGGATNPYSDELARSTQVTNSQPTIFHGYAHPEWSSSRERAWREEQRTLDRTNGGGRQEASNYPPLYYFYEAIFYAAARDAEIHTRLGVMRLGSMLWLLVTALGAWLLAGELFGGRRLPQLLAGATAGMWPMLGFISGSINPDAMLYALSTLALWRGVVLLRRGLTLRRGLLFGALVGAATITKAAALVLIPPALLLLAFLWWRDRSGRMLLAAGLGALALAAPLAAWTGYTIASDRAAYAQAAQIGGTADAEGFQTRELVSYVWQFYLPRLPFMTEVDHHVPVVSDLPLFNTWIGMSWGTFGWVTTWWQKWVYQLFAAITAAVALTALWGAWRSRRGWVRDPRRRDPVVFLGGVTLITLAALHWTDYGFYAAERGLFAQGRYLFPLAGVGAVVVAFALTSLPGRARSIVAGVWLGGLIVLQFAAYGLVNGAWYA